MRFWWDFDSIWHNCWFLNIDNVFLIMFNLSKIAYKLGQMSLFLNSKHYLSNLHWWNQNWVILIFKIIALKDIKFTYLVPFSSCFTFSVKSFTLAPYLKGRVMSGQKNISENVLRTYKKLQIINLKIGIQGIEKDWTGR